MESICYEAVIKDLKTKTTFQTFAKPSTKKSNAHQNDKHFNHQEFSKPSVSEKRESLETHSESPDINLCESFLKNLSISKSTSDVDATAILDEITFTKKPDMVLFCQALFLNSITKSKLSADQLKVIEEILNLYFHPENKRELENVTISTLCGDLYESAKIVMEDFLGIESTIISEIDVFTLCCSSATLMFMQLEEEKNETQLLLENDLPVLLVHIINLVESLQKLIATETIQLFLNEPHYTKLNIKWVIWLSKVNSCLSILEIIMNNTTYKGFIVKLLNFSIVSDIIWLFGFCLDNIFRNPVFKNNSSNEENQELSVTAKKVLKTCILSLLKVLISFSSTKCDHNQYGSLLMQKMMACFFEVSTSKFEERFEIQILAFEILILMMDNCWLSSKEFCEVMLMKKTFANNKSRTIINMLILNLMGNLNKIKDMEKIAIVTPNSGYNAAPMSILENPVSMEHVAEFGEIHMEITMITAYSAVLLGIFCQDKQSYKDVVYTHIPPIHMKACVDVLKKFKEFMQLLDTLNPVGKKYLDRAIEMFDELE